MKKYIYGGKVVGGKEITPIVVDTTTTKIIGSKPKTDNKLIKTSAGDRLDILVVQQLIELMNQNSTINDHFDYSGFGIQIKNIVDNIVNYCTKNNIKEDSTITCNTIHDAILSNGGYLKVSDIARALSYTPFGKNYLS